MKITELYDGYVGEVSGVDLADSGSDTHFQDLQAALDHCGVLVFHGTPMDQERQIAWAGQFGRLEGEGQNVNIVMQGKARISHQLADISNVDASGDLMARQDRRRMFSLGNQLWHTDSSFKRIPAKYSALHAHSVAPEGGETQFADMRAAYDALPQAMKERIEDLVAEHSIFCSRAKLGFMDFTDEERASLPPVHRPLVRVHPATGRKALYLASHASHIHGMEVPDGRMLIRELLEHATQREFVHTHKWAVGDLVIWDNRCTLHRGRPYDDAKYARDMRRATVEDDDPAMEHRAVA
jgi:alpha-ketoglutarate-dependent 2,4-dichlorophenoxyacetate dioxygenase